jgi:hypothetical protein
MDPSDIQALAEAIRGLNDQNDEAPAIRAVSLKLPEFWSVDPEIWFARIESMFNNRGISQDNTKFDYVVSALDNVTSVEVKSVLVNPPAHDKYLTLCSALLEAFGKSQTQKDAELLNLSGLGDKSPSALLRKIRSLNSDAETLRCALFLQQLPVEVRTVLAGLNIASLDELAKAADRMVEARFDLHQSSAFAVSATKSNFEPSGDNRVCYYHSTYGPKAQKCQMGCLFASLPRQRTPSRATSENDQAGR